MVICITHFAYPKDVTIIGDGHEYHEEYIECLNCLNPCSNGSVSQMTYFRY